MHPSGGPLFMLKISSLDEINFSVSRSISRSPQAPKLVKAPITLALEARSIALASLRNNLVFSK